jgi:hypothetical protein
LVIGYAAAHGTPVPGLAAPASGPLPVAPVRAVNG